MDFILNRQVLGLNRLCPPVYLIEYAPENYSRELFLAHHIKQPAELNNWVIKRKAQFLAGRIAAQDALRASSAKQDIAEIGIGRSRQPLWPDGIKGSISHDQNISVAVAQAGKAGGIGIDIQSVFTDEETQKNINLILSASDQALFENGSLDLSENQLATLFFSAKECFFKAAFHEVGEYFDFADVSIIAIDEQAGQIQLASNIELSETIKPGKQLTANFEMPGAQNTIICCINYCGHSPGT